MKKTISLPSYMNDMLKDVSKRTKNTDSGVIQHALTIYFFMEKYAPQQIIGLSKMIPNGQTEIFDFLQNGDLQKRQ